MNKRNLIITSISVFLTTTLIFLGIFFGLKKPDEVKKEDDDQTLKKEIETLENEFKTLKSNFDDEFNKLQNEDFYEYPQDDQKQINQIKEELQKFKEEIAQKQCDLSELVAKKTCLLKINSQITNQNEKFDIIVIVGQINIDATKLKNFQNFNQNDTSFVDSKLIAEIKNVDKFYQDFHVKKQECFNETKSQARKICFEHLKKKLNSNFALVINVNNTYYEQKNKISTSISDLFTQIDKDFYQNKPPEFGDLSFVNQTFHDNMNTIKNFYANFLNNGKKCNDKLLKDKKECLEKLKKELDDTLTLISKINKDYDDQEKNITDFINSFEIKNNILINLDLSFVNDLQLIRNINDIKNLYQESNQNCSKLIKLNDRKKCLEGPTFELISNSSDEIIKKYNEQKEAIKKGIQTIINELEKKIKELKIKKEILQFDDLSFMNQTEFHDRKTKINNFYDNFVSKNQTCFNKEKLKDQKECLIGLTNELNATLILVNNTNKTYYDQKKNISDQIEKFKNELDSLKELIVNNYDVLIQQVLIKPINLEIKKIKTEVNCNHEKLLGLKFSCYQEQINKSKNITSPLNYDFGTLQNEIKNISSNVNLISSKLYDLIFSDIISLFTKEEKIKEQLTKEITDFLEYYQLLKSINNIDIDKLTNNNATTLSALINKIVDFIGVKKQYNESDILNELKNELNSLEELTVNNYDVITQQIFIKSINQEIKDIKKVNCDNKKTLKLKLFCYQEQINKIKEITSISYYFGGNYYCHIHNVNNNKDLISSQLYNLIFNDNIILSTKKEKIKEQLTKEINTYFTNNQYYRIFKTLNYQNVIYSFFSRRYSTDILIKKLNNNENNNFLALITKISDFIHLKVEIEKFVKSRLQSKFLGTYNNVNNTLDFVLFVAKPLILLSNVVVNIAMLFSSGKTNKITRLTISFGYYYLVYNSSPSTISEGSDALKTDSFLVEKYNKYVYNPLNNYFFEVKSSYLAIYSELFGSINLTQELKIKITNLENMSDDELNDIIQQIQQKENSLVASFNGFTFHDRKIKQIIIVFSHMAIYYGISLLITKLIELIGKLCKNNPTLNRGGDQNLGHDGYYYYHNSGWHKKITFIPAFLYKFFAKKEEPENKEMQERLRKKYENVINNEEIKENKEEQKEQEEQEENLEYEDALDQTDIAKIAINKIKKELDNLKKNINKVDNNEILETIESLKDDIQKIIPTEDKEIEQEKTNLFNEINELVEEITKEIKDDQEDKKEEDKKEEKKGRKKQNNLDHYQKQLIKKNVAEKIKAFEARFQKLKSSYQNKRNDLKKITGKKDKNKIFRLLKDLNDLKKQVEDLQIDDNYQAEISQQNQLQQEIAALISKISIVKAAFEIEEKIAKLKKITIESNLARAMEKIQQLREEIKELQEQINNNNDDEQLTAKISSLKQILNAKYQEIKNLVAECDELLKLEVNQINDRSIINNHLKKLALFTTRFQELLAVAKEADKKKIQAKLAQINALTEKLLKREEKIKKILALEQRITELVNRFEAYKTKYQDQITNLEKIITMDDDLINDEGNSRYYFNKELKEIKADPDYEDKIVNANKLQEISELMLKIANRGSEISKLIIAKDDIEKCQYYKKFNEIRTTVLDYKIDNIDKAHNDYYKFRDSYNQLKSDVKQLKEKIKTEITNANDQKILNEQIEQIEQYSLPINEVIESFKSKIEEPKNEQPKEENNQNKNEDKKEQKENKTENKKENENKNQLENKHEKEDKKDKKDVEEEEEENEEVEDSEDEHKKEEPKKEEDKNKNQLENKHEQEKLKTQEQLKEDKKIENKEQEQPKEDNKKDEEVKDQKELNELVKLDESKITDIEKINAIIEKINTLKAKSEKSSAQIVNSLQERFEKRKKEIEIRLKLEEKIADEFKTISTDQIINSNDLDLMKEKIEPYEKEMLMLKNNLDENIIREKVLDLNSELNKKKVQLRTCNIRQRLEELTKLDESKITDIEEINNILGELDSFESFAMIECLVLPLLREQLRNEIASLKLKFANRQQEIKNRLLLENHIDFDTIIHHDPNDYENSPERRLRDCKEKKLKNSFDQEILEAKIKEFEEKLQEYKNSANKQKENLEGENEKNKNEEDNKSVKNNNELDEEDNEEIEIKSDNENNEESDEEDDKK